MYPEKYYPALVGRDTPRESQQDKIALVRRYRNAGRLLDVGAGVGLFVLEAHDEGYDAQGVEISAQAVETGTAALKVPLVCGDFLATEMPASDYDIVTLWHVFEHLPDPRAILAKVHHILQPSGIVIIGVPNFESMQSRFFRSRWYHLDVPAPFVQTLRPGLLVVMLDKSGFRVNEIRYGWSRHDSAGILGSIMRLTPGEVWCTRASGSSWESQLPTHLPVLNHPCMKGEPLPSSQPENDANRSV